MVSCFARDVFSWRRSLGSHFRGEDRVQLFPLAERYFNPMQCSNKSEEGGNVFTLDGTIWYMSYLRLPRAPYKVAQFHQNCINSGGFSLKFTGKFSTKLLNKEVHPTKGSCLYLNK